LILNDHDLVQTKSTSKSTVTINEHSSGIQPLNMKNIQEVIDRWEPKTGHNWTAERIEEYLAATDRSQIYRVILLKSHPVVTVGDMNHKLSNQYHGMALKALDRLCTDGLLIKGPFFSSITSTGQETLHEGYLKGFPADNMQSTNKFAEKLASYNILHTEYTKSFKSSIGSKEPRVLSHNDLKPSFMFSKHLVNIVNSSQYLQQRIIIDSSAVRSFDSANQPSSSIHNSINTLIFLFLVYMYVSVHLDNDLWYNNTCSRQKKKKPISKKGCLRITKPCDKMQLRSNSK
ncbi:unnamed protein product, partial [Rotaria sp. Silwood1]